MRWPAELGMLLPRPYRLYVLAVAIVWSPLLEPEHEPEPEPEPEPSGVVACNKAVLVLFKQPGGGGTVLGDVTLRLTTRRHVC